jgi:uncharacterized protein (DUF2252 family)
MAQTASESIKAYNAGREPERLAIKLAAMRSNAFSFLRGTCHLFYERMTEHDLAPAGPAAWICGDLHLENFGTYLGDNDLTYFDVNDFDEAMLAPHAWDILRLAVSVRVAAPVIGLKPGHANSYAQQLVENYYAELARGKPRWIERRTATGAIGDLIDSLKKRDEVKFLAKRTIVKGAKRALLVDGTKLLALAKSDREPLATFMQAVGKTYALPKALTLIDAARRVAGTGSLGIARYALLVEGDGSPDGNWLLDLKATAGSALGPYNPVSQPVWATEADRVVSIQTLFQANMPSLLSAHTFGGGSYVLKQLQPIDDRLDLGSLTKTKAAFDGVIEQMAKLAAWGHLRGAGRYGSPPGDTLVAAGGDGDMVRSVLDKAARLADITTTDWAEFCTAYDRGDLKVS